MGCTISHLSLSDQEKRDMARARQRMETLFFADLIGQQDTGPETMIKFTELTYSVLQKEYIDPISIFKIKFDHVAHYEGVKILVYLNQPYLPKKIDPHFYPDGCHPIARFEPTAQGWLMAIAFAKAWKGQTMENQKCEHKNAYTAWTGQIKGVGLPYYQVDDSDFGAHMVCPDCGEEWDESNVDMKEK